MDTTRMSVGLVADGPFSDARTNSGVAAGLLSGLRARPEVEVAFAEGTQLDPVRVAATRALALRLPVEQWKLASHHGDLPRRWRSRVRDRILAAHAPVDLLIHVRNVYTPVATPYAAFIDTTSAIARRTWPAWSGRWALNLPDAEEEYFASATCVLTAGREAARSVVTDYGVPEERVAAIGGGTNFSHVPEPDWARFDADGPLRVLFVGYHFERKGGDIVVEAIRRVRGAGRDVELTVVTSASVPDEPGVTRLAPEWDRDRLSALYASHHVFCLPARHEPYGLVVQEAMAHGLAVITSGVGSFPDIVRDGATGWACTTGSADEVAARIDELATGREVAERMGRTGRRIALEEMTWEAVAGRALAAVQRVTEVRP